MRRKPNVKRKIAALLALLLAGVLALTGCGLTETGQTGRTVPAEAPAAAVSAPERTEAPAEEPEEDPDGETGPVTEPQAIADYLFEHGELPENFITKSEAQDLGWDSSRNYLSDVAPGKSIGGDRFGNYEGQLPKAKGRKFFECDANYIGGKRGAERIVYSNDGHVWYTKDHYETFEELFPSE